MCRVIFHIKLFCTGYAFLFYSPKPKTQQKFVLKESASVKNIFYPFLRYEYTVRLQTPHCPNVWQQTDVDSLKAKAVLTKPLCTTTAVRCSRTHGSFLAIVTKSHSTAD